MQHRAAPLCRSARDATEPAGCERRVRASSRVQAARRQQSRGAEQGRPRTIATLSSSPRPQGKQDAAATGRAWHLEAAVWLQRGPPRGEQERRSARRARDAGVGRRPRFASQAHW
eukprot:scaffold2213_cov444-Prasinococcus_capsulatus_cf.AAC.3